MTTKATRQARALQQVTGSQYTDALGVSRQLANNPDLSPHDADIEQMTSADNWVKLYWPTTVGVVAGIAHREYRQTEALHLSGSHDIVRAVIGERLDGIVVDANHIRATTACSATQAAENAVTAAWAQWLTGHSTLSIDSTVHASTRASILHTLDAWLSGGGLDDTVRADIIRELSINDDRWNVTAILSRMLDSWIDDDISIVVAGMHATTN